MLDYRLQTFLTLCETMNYTRAAEKLCVTQPAVTQHIRFLERYYGCRLFSYQGKALELTAKGKQLREGARSLSYNSERIRLLMLEQEPLTLRIGATKTIGEYLMAPVVENLLKEAENGNLSLLVDNTDELLQALDQGKLDFVLLEGFFDKQKYGYRPYRKEAFVGVCAAGHPLAQRTVSLKELFSQRLLIREPGSGTRAIFERYLQGENESLQSFATVTQISDFSVMKRLLERGMGIGFLYRLVVEKELKAGKLQLLKLEGPEMSGEFNFVYLKENLFMKDWEALIFRCFPGIDDI